VVRCEHGGGAKYERKAHRKNRTFHIKPFLSLLGHLVVAEKPRKRRPQMRSFYMAYDPPFP
jgi:hypothetical protein